MNQRQDNLRQLVREGFYVVDDEAVAYAIVARARVCNAVPGLKLRRPERRPQVRSFRCQRGVPSFRLMGA